MARLSAVVRQPPFKFKTEPWPHQRDALRRAWGKLAFAYLLKMRRGKTKLVIDEACALLRRGDITALVVVAPHGVHVNWVAEQWDAHGTVDAERVAWTGKNTQTDQRVLLKALNSERPYVFAINYDALITDRGFRYVQSLLAQRNCMLVLDEAHRIKTPGAKRAKAALKLAPLAKFRRILTGTPLANSPLDLYMPFRFLDERILGFTQFWAFRQRYAVMKERHVATHAFKEIIGYQFLDELRERISPHSYSLTDDQERALKLPSYQYLRLPVELSPLQRRLYTELTDELITRLDSGEEMSAALAITQLMRLQQLLGGWFVPDQWGVPYPDETVPIIGARMGHWITDDVLPRERQLLEYLRDVPGKVIIWTRFVPERERLKNLLAKEFGPVSAWTVSAETPGKSIEQFRVSETVRFLVASPEGPAGEGVDLSCARTMVYYSNSFRLVARVQSEARPEKVGLREPITVVDLVAPGTVDERLVANLTAKKDLARTFSGEELRKWLR